MILRVEKSSLAGNVLIPASKSHTVRAVAIGSLATGVSHVTNPLMSSDTLSAADIYRGFGARIDSHHSSHTSYEPHSVSSEDHWIMEGVGGDINVPDDVLNVGNSGTTLYIAMGTAALIDGYTVFTGDEQIRRRPAAPLIKALSQLGADAFSTRVGGMPPLVISGPIKGGSIHLDGSKTSQYLSSLLINCPLAENDTEIIVSNAVEKPYIDITLSWLDDQGITYDRDGYERFLIHGGQKYRAFDKAIPGDFSSATFFLCAAAITGSELTLLGLDMNDPQGDKAVVDMLREMGAEVEQLTEGIRIKGRGLKGAEFDLRGTPDALPAMAVTACFAEGETRLVNVPQARLKETDRLQVMCQELTAMGGKVEELPDGLIIQGSPLHAAKVQGHADHRVVMALAVAGLACEGTTQIDTAEAVSITFPSFAELMQGAGARLSFDAD